MIPDIIKNNSALSDSARTLYELKAENLVFIDIRKIPTITDEYLFICTCESEVQMRAILNKMQTFLKSRGMAPVVVEYSPGVKWGILSCGDFMLHVFEENTRSYYSLERLWGDAPQYELVASDFIDPSAPSSPQIIQTGTGSDDDRYI